MNYALLDDLVDAYESGLTGWTPEPEETERFVASLPHPLVSDTGAPDIDEDFHPILHVLGKFPDWERLAQAIGSCVGWGWELAAFMLACMEGNPPFEFSTEAIYSGSRVEARGGRLAGYSDGSYGSVAAKWVRDWGVLLRKDYSAETGIADHNLTKYDGNKEKEWGNFGCGGKKDERGEGAMDKLARMHPVTDVTLVKSAEDARRVRKPISICSNVGYGQMRRDADGIVRAKGIWNHCMALGGHMKHHRYGWVYRMWQSWGRSCSGPDEAMHAAIDKHFSHLSADVRAKMKDAVSACSWWVTAEDLDRMLRQGDSFALAGLNGWKRVDYILL